MVNKDVNVDENDLMITPELANCLLVQTGMIIMNYCMTNTRETDTTQRKKVLKPSTIGLNTVLTVFQDVGVRPMNRSKLLKIT